ncbi:MMPL family transporter [Virgibacillus dakarensis]|uniref:Membrane protein n=1 Tax=Lentibacillus populi TaxID=1827502 RepID=A0A9W5X7A7_9BACI|nr:MMPL family transporter [Lentibacillus populi]MTW87886.1 MMPL family transporter [Virgibacillus dakarensis]GGB58796.1 membrane protein [Lentibacillus populi]
MKSAIHYITDRVATKKGMWITLAIWLMMTVLLAGLAPGARDFQVSGIDSLPDDTQSVIAQKKKDNYFADNDGIPALLVFQSEDGKVEQGKLAKFLNNVEQENISGLKRVIPLEKLPPEAAESFFSEDHATALIPLTFDSSLDSKEIQHSLEKVYTLAKEATDFTLYITGPAGISADTLELFSRADIVLILSTVAIILILLIVIYRSPLLALIPLFAAAFVYEITNQVLGLMGKAGLTLDNQSLSIMSILLFASITDYSLFVLARFREELKEHNSKFDAMKQAMRGSGVPVFFSGGTVLAAMLVLFFAQFGDYRNFAPIFATAMIVVILASITLVPALFTLFGRKSFWPRIPHVGDRHVKTNSLWSKVGRFVSRKPIVSVVLVGIILLVSASNVLTIDYEFDTMKSFPDDMPSREGYDILEKSFEPGDLAPTTVLFEAKDAVPQEEQRELAHTLSEQPLVNNVQVNGVTDDEKVVSYRMTFATNPYAVETMDALEGIRGNAAKLIDQSKLNGDLYFAGETAASVDDRSVNNRDLIVIVSLETILIFLLLILLTRSFKMPIYMMGTILVSFVAALGLGTFLMDLFFDIDTISNRVPLYSFVFLVALGVDYNIILISRFIEERKKRTVKQAVEVAVANTGGVISSAGIILASTFAVLMTQPVELLFVFGFIVAVGILLDTFLIRGVLLPGLLVLLEKDKDKERGEEV